MKGGLFMAGFSLILVFFSIFTIGAIFLLTFCITLIIGYVLLSISLTCLAKNNGYGEYAVLAWIPPLNFFLIGLLCGDVNFLNLLRVKANIFSVLSIISFLAFAILFLFFGIDYFTIELIMLGLFFMSYLHITYGLLRKIHKSSAPYLTFLAAVFPIIPIAFIFVKRNTVFEDELYIEE